MDRNFGSIRTNDKELRIVMVGKTGIGKSATGNTILGLPCFESKFSAKSMTVDCSKGRTTVDGQQVAVIDTPGLFDTRFGLDKTTEDVCQCITYAAPGPHVFLVVIRLGRYTEEEKHTVQRIQEMFGQAADRYSMVLFTHGDQLEGTIEDFVGESPDLQELVERCNGQYHVFNNKLTDRSQVTELLQKIRNVAQQNGGSHYTNEMFQEAERVVEEKKQSIIFCKSVHCFTDSGCFICSSCITAHFIPAHCSIHQHKKWQQTGGNMAKQLPLWTENGKEKPNICTVDCRQIETCNVVL